MTNIDFEAALSDWRQWPVSYRPIIVREFADGQNHNSVLLADAERRLVLKCFARPSELAVTMQRYAADCGLTPKVLYSPYNHGYLLMEAIPSSALLANKAIKQSDIECLGSSLRRLHAMDTQILADRPSFDVFLWSERYLGSGNGELLAAQEAVEPILAEFHTHPSPLCVSHNDLVAENCFVSDGSALFIDWEFAQLNKPWFDLAALSIYLNLNARQSTLLLEAYQASDHTAEQSIYIAAQCAVLWLDVLWYQQNFSGTHPLQEQKLRRIDRLISRHQAASNYNLSRN